MSDESANGMESRDLQTDQELVETAARGDRAAFHALVDRHGADLHRLARSLCRTRQDAEDIVQETFIGAYRGLARFDGRASVRTWLSRILVRQAAKAWHRSKKRWGTLPLQDPEAEMSGWRKADGRGGAASAVDSVDRRIDLRAVLDTLGNDHRQVILLREMQGLSYAEIAQTLGVPQGTIESRLHRARNELREKLAGYLT